MKKIILLILLVSVFYPFSGALTEDSEEIKLYLGQPKIIFASMPQKIVIDDPRVLDVTAVAEDGLTLLPKAVGVTTLMLTDNSGEQSYRIRVLQEDVTDVKLRIDSLLKELKLSKVNTKVAENESKVLLLGTVKTSEDKDRINLALGPLKEKTVDLIKVEEEAAVVDIDVQVLELDKGATKTLGFTWPNGSTITMSEQGYPTAAAPVSFASIFTVHNTFNRGQFSWTLDALIQEGKGRILSQPHIACQSGKEAELLVGGEKPIFTTSVASTTGASGTSVEYKEYGIKLKVKPVVTEDKRIKLALNIEVSELETTSAEYLGNSTSTTAKAYPLKKRTASTEVYLDNGQTMAIGGMVKQKSEEELQKVPWLADIPVLGFLFRKRTTTLGDGHSTRGDTELFITLTPTLLSVKEEAAPAAVAAPVSRLPVETKPLSAETTLPQELKDYTKTVQLKIINAVYYPQQAKELGWEGTVALVLRLTANGELKDARIAKSSGYKALDDAALEVVKKQAPYSAFPAQVKLEELRIEVPVIFSKN